MLCDDPMVFLIGDGWMDGREDVGVDALNALSKDFILIALISSFELT